MKEKKNKLFYIVIALVVLIPIVSFLMPKGEVHVPQTTKGVFVYDEADMIDADTEDEINSILVTLEEETTAEVAVVSYVDSNLSIEEYATKLMNEMGVGKEDTNNGILLLMQKQGNHVRLEVGRGIDDDLTDEMAGDILDEYYVPYRDSSTSRAALETTKAVAGFFYNYYGISNEYSTVRSHKHAEEDAPDPVFWLIMLGVPVALTLGIIGIDKYDKKRSRNKSRLILPNERKRKGKFGRAFGDFIDFNYNDYGGGYDGGFGGGGSDGGGASR
ncbi:MAG: TPM domain-containing protein [Butyrivibrio sp.]|nr:TPM domain-containing protein [Butyrivibrio sp.]